MESPIRIVPRQTYVFTVPPEMASIRLDKYMATQFPGYSRTFIQELIARGHITINKQSISKSSYLLKISDVVCLTGPDIQVESTVQKKVVLPVEILYTHEDFLVLNKPAGLMVHPPEQNPDTAKNNISQATLIDWILEHHCEIAHIGTIDRPGIVHRLDKDTSGIILVARTQHAHLQFSAFFKNRTIHKTYHALVEGHPPLEGTVALPIGRHPVLRHKMATFTKTDKKQAPVIREATTHYRVLEYFDNCALIEAKPVTGRTHQIRVHMAAIGHPLLGDQTYGKKSLLIKRHALHAHAISFVFGSTEYEFVCPKPDDFDKAEHELKALKRKTV